MHFCSTCGHQASNNAHLGYHEMDMHHSPTSGTTPLGYGTASWAYSDDKTQVIVTYFSPEGEKSTLVRPLED